ncbi:MAG: ATP-binding cassette domain-containing protein [Coriobacteriia bacterium]|nr:ATP-binding cassette domain-containing protein [Coriobacteriia bacterium]
MILFEEVTFWYRHDGAPAVDGFSLRIGDGERVALVGPNGSGKSTVALLADGLLLPARGRVLVDGLDTRDASARDRVRSAVGLVLQNPENQIVGATVEEDVAFGPENLALPPDEIRRRVNEAIDAVGLSGLERREPHTLSEGQKQRLAIAGALAMRARHLVLDEPTAMLDPAGRESVLDAVARFRAEGGTVIHVTHDASEIALCERAVCIRDGRLVFDGASADLLADAALMDALGIEPSPLAAVAKALSEAGVSVPPVPDVEEVVRALWR